MNPKFAKTIEEKRFLTISSAAEKISYFMVFVIIVKMFS